MNAPPTFESFLLFDGEKKIIKEIDTKVSPCVETYLYIHFISYFIHDDFVYFITSYLHSNKSYYFID